MKVLLIDADGKYPNRALMVISQYHKGRNDKVFLKKGLEPTLPLDCLNPNIAYMSCIFDWNRQKVLSFAEQLKSVCDVVSGGSGISLSSFLPNEVEHLMPDYELYGIDYSIGFTSRGCIRNCPFCIVPKKEGTIRDNAPISEFLHPSHRKLILYDNNFLASPKWHYNLIDIINLKIKVSFNQGLDIRLIDHENARLLAKTRLTDDQFRRRRIYYSWDLPQCEDQVLEGIRTLKKAGFNGASQMCYVLVGFNTTYQDDLHRIHTLIKEDVLPFVMTYNYRKDSYYPYLSRWVNKRYYKVIPWEKFDRGNSQQIIKELENKGLDAE